VPMKMKYWLEERPARAHACGGAPISVWSDCGSTRMSIGLPTAYTPANTSRTHGEHAENSQHAVDDDGQTGYCARKWCEKVNSSVRGA